MESSAQKRIEESKKKAMLVERKNDSKDEEGDVLVQEAIKLAIRCAGGDWFGACRSGVWSFSSC